MKAVLVTGLFLILAAIPVFADQGCIETSTTTVTIKTCARFECSQKLNGSCVMWSCNETHTRKYVDGLSSGCSRYANCGRKAVFAAGVPSDPQVESTEICDWYPCVMSDPVTKACRMSMCVSKRIFETTRVSYPDARCAPLAASSLLQPQGESPAPRRRETLQPVPQFNGR